MQSIIDSLKKVANEVRHRAPSHLEAVDLDSVPAEIEPIVSELNSLFEKLKEAFDRNERFTADAAHELKTPLAALNTQTQVALRANTPESRKAALFKVLAGVNRATHVVQQLLTLSRLVPGASDIAESLPVNLPKLAAEIIAQLAPVAVSKQIDIELISDDEDATIQGNMTALSILIRNLVDNAIRYTPAGGHIQVQVLNKEKPTKLIVSDNGPGIPAELRARVFERFFRVLGNTSPGSGLGLAIVQQIAKLHNAQVKLGTPASGSGLEIEVIFPNTSQH